MSSAVVAEPRKTLTVIPNIAELKIADPHHVKLVSDGPKLNHTGVDGKNVTEEFFYIQAESGEIKKTKNARDPRQIVLKINEGANIQAKNFGMDLKFLKVEQGHVIFRYTRWSSKGDTQDAMISVLPYKK